MILSQRRSAPKCRGSHEGAPMRRMSVFPKRSRSTVLVAALAMAVTLGIAPAQNAVADGPSWDRAMSQPEPQRPSVVRLIVPDQAAFQRLVAAGTDLTGHVLRSPDGTVEVDAVLTQSQVTALRGQGISTVPATESPAQDKQARPTAAAPRATGAADQVTIERAVWFKTAGQHFITVQARTSAGAPDGLALTAEWTGARGTSGEAALSPFVDANTYMGHLTSTPAP